MAPIPLSKFAEPSEPSDVRPSGQAKPQLSSSQEENPQLVTRNREMQAVDGGVGHKTEQNLPTTTLKDRVLVVARKARL